MTERISPSRFHEHGWRVLRDDACTYFATGSFAKGVELVDAIAEVAMGDRHPDIDLRPEGVTVRLGTHGPLPTEEDLLLAERISAVARELGVSIDLDGFQAVQVAIDALVIPEVLPFWQAVLGYRKVADEDLIDPRLSGPPFWFQQMDAPRPQRNRIHLDVTVPHDVAEARVAAALAAGGHVVDDSHARAFWVLADAEGNEACVSTWLDRS